MTVEERGALIDGLGDHDDAMQWRENQAYRDGLILKSLRAIALLLAELVESKGSP